MLPLRAKWPLNAATKRACEGRQGRGTSRRQRSNGRPGLGVVGKREVHSEVPSRFYRFLDGKTRRGRAVRWRSRLSVARPNTLPAPAVAVLHEVFGVNADIRKTCGELAEQGFIAVAPDLFWRQEPGVDLSVT